MRTLLMIVILCTGMQQSYAQVMFQIKTDEVKKWHYQFGDEFNESAVNLQKWMWAPGWGNAVVSQSVYFTNGQNVYVENGEAHFVAKREDYMGHVNEWEYDSATLKKLDLKVVDHKLPFKYTAGALWSRSKFKSGFFECRFKTNSQKGTWPAFWLYSGNKNDEIDWFELKGERQDQAHVDVHCPTGCNNYRGGFLYLRRGWGGWLTFDRSLAVEYNTISGMWSGNEMIWYLNGEPLCNFEHKYDSTMWLILNTGIASDNNGGFSPGPDKSTIFPNDFIVDYVRVWSEANTTTPLPGEFLNSEKTMPRGKEPLARPEKKLNFIYKKKLLKKELGFVTLLPLAARQYSLTFMGRKFGDAKVEVMNDAGVKVKELSLKDPEYALLDLNELPAGKYTVQITTLGKTFGEKIDLPQFTR